MRRFPAEWEPQSGILLTWPHAKTAWANDLDQIELLYTKLASLISKYESVLIVTTDNDTDNLRIRKLLLQADAVVSRIHFYSISSNDTWARDHGPLGVFIGQNQPLLLNFIFNGWGGKFQSDLDNQITKKLATAGAFGNCELESIELVLEGGAIETDGRGVLLATKRTLIDTKRNPDWSLLALENELRKQFGIKHFLCLNHGLLSGDDTDGHIDTLARFCTPNTICYVQSKDHTNIDFNELHAMEQELKSLRDLDNHPYRLIPLPTPRLIWDQNGKILPASYANFLIINQAVLVPTYQDPADDDALNIISKLFPNHAIHSFDCRILITQGGSLHCACMQLPLGISFR